LPSCFSGPLSNTQVNCEQHQMWDWLCPIVESCYLFIGRIAMCSWLNPSVLVCPSSVSCQIFYLHHQDLAGM
jgi:hypothetical protein